MIPERVVADDLTRELDGSAGALDDRRERERGCRLADAVRADEGDLRGPRPGHVPDPLPADDRYPAASRRIARASSMIGAEVLLATERLGVQLRDVFSARRSGREPAVVGDDLEPTDRGAVAGRRGQDGGDRLARERPDADRLGRQPPQR